MEEEEFLNPNGIYTQEEIDAILEYRRTGKLPVWPYEELDFNNTGGILNVNDRPEDPTE